MGALKNLGKEQLTLLGAILLSLLLNGWQSTRGGAGPAPASMAGNERFYGTPRMTPIEAVETRPDRYLQGRDITEPPVTGQLPVPEIRHPEPRLDGPALPPLRPMPNFDAFNRALLPAKDRMLPKAAVTAFPAWLPGQAEVDWLRALKEPEAPGQPDRRKQFMRPTGDSIIHRKPPLSMLEGRILVDEPNKPIDIVVVRGQGTQRLQVKPEEIDRNFPGTEDGIERGYEFERDYERRRRLVKPSDLDGYLRLAKWCREQAGMLPEAREAYHAAFELAVQRPGAFSRVREILFMKCDTMRDLGDYEGAIQTLMDYLDDVRGGAGESADLHGRLGDYFRALGVLERAAQCYQVAAALEPARQVWSTTLARVQMDLGRDAEAAGTMAALAGGKMDPGASLVHGIVLLRQGNPAAAQAAFAAALAGQPGSAEALAGLGTAMILQGQPEGAGKYLEAIRADQYQLDAWINLGIMYLSAGLADAATVVFEGAVQRDPDAVSAYAGLGLAQYLRSGGRDTGGYFERALQVRPGHFYVRYVQGHLALKAGRSQEALDFFTESFRSEPNFLPAYRDAALAYLALARDEQRAGQFGPVEQRSARMERAATCRVSAETLLTTIRDLDPTRLDTYVALGCTYAVQGRPGEALAALNQGATGGADPLVEYARGFVDYWYTGENRKQGIELAEGRFRSGATIQPAGEWTEACAEALRKIEDWKSKRIYFEDRFDGGISKQAQWVEIFAPNGPQLQVRNGRLVIQGQQGAGRANKITGLERPDIPGAEFLSAEGSIHWDTLAGMNAGVSLLTTKPTGSGAAASGQGIHIFLLEDPVTKAAKLTFGFGLAPRERGPEQQGAFSALLPAGAKSIRYRIERKDEANRTWAYDLQLWDEALKDFKSVLRTPVKMSAPNEIPPFIFGVWAKAPLDSGKVDVSFDDVQVLISTKPR